MDSRPNFSLFLLLVVLLHLSPTYNSGELDCRAIYHDPPQVPQEVRQALWEKDNYKIMAIVLEKALSRLFLCGNLRKRVIGNPRLTIFAPRDDAIRFDNQTSLYHQFVTTKLAEEEKGAFGRPHVGSRRRTCFNRYVKIGRSSVNNVSVVDWSLYNSGKGIIVHGVEDFFKMEPLAYVDRDYGYACIK